jgi:hypothetical protein
MGESTNDHHVFMDEFEEVELPDGDYFPADSDEEEESDREGEDDENGQVEIELFIGTESELTEILFNQ